MATLLTVALFAIFAAFYSYVGKNYQIGKSGNVKKCQNLRFSESDHILFATLVNPVHGAVPYVVPLTCNSIPSLLIRYRKARNDIPNNLAAALLYLVCSQRLTTTTFVR